MSLTSYRAAPPRVISNGPGLVCSQARSCWFVSASRKGLLHPASIGGRRTEDRGRNGALAPLRSVVRRLLSVVWMRNTFVRAVGLFGCSVLGRPGGDLLSRVLGRSTIGAEGFHGRVRDGIGCWPLAIATRPCGDQRFRDQMTGIRILFSDP